MPNKLQSFHVEMQGLEKRRKSCKPIRGVGVGGGLSITTVMHKCVDSLLLTAPIALLLY